MDRQEAGAALRNKRTSLELSLEDVARATLLRKSILESLEAGGPPEPDGFFKSYARRYAKYLGLNSDEVVAAFVGSSTSTTVNSDIAAVQPSKLGRSATTVPIYKKKRSLVSTALIAVVALVVAVVLLSRQWPAPVVPGGQTGPSSTPSVPSDTVSPSAPATPSIPDTTPVLPTQGTITLRFTSTTQRAWLEITVDGSVVFSGTLLPGDSTQATGNHVVVDFGNAMYTRVTANGVDQGVASHDKTVMTLEYGSPAHTP